MATKQSSTPSFFNFLKEGFLLPNRNRSLFAAIFALAIASSSFLLLTNDLTIQPLLEEMNLDVKALNSTDPMSPRFTELVKEIQEDTRELMIHGAIYLLFAVVVGSAVRIVVLFGAVATYSGELHTFGTLLGKAKAQLKGPMLTLAFLYVLECVYVVILTVVVAVLVPRCHGAGAVRRAWRMVKGKRSRVMLFIAATSVLVAATWPVHKLAMACALKSLASGLLLDLVYATVMTAVGLFAACAITALYYECKHSMEVAASEYVKVSTEEAT